MCSPTCRTTCRAHAKTRSHRAQEPRPSSDKPARSERPHILLHGSVAAPVGAIHGIKEVPHAALMRCRMPRGWSPCTWLEPLVMSALSNALLAALTGVLPRQRPSMHIRAHLCRRCRKPRECRKTTLFAWFLAAGIPKTMLLAWLLAAGMPKTTLFAWCLAAGMPKTTLFAWFGALEMPKTTLSEGGAPKVDGRLTQR